MILAQLTQACGETIPAAARRQGVAAAQAQAQAPEIAVAAGENPLVVSDRMGFQEQVYSLSNEAIHAVCVRECQCRMCASMTLLSASEFIG